MGAISVALWHKKCKFSLKKQNRLAISPFSIAKMKGARFKIAETWKKYKKKKNKNKKKEMLCFLKLQAPTPRRCSHPTSLTTSTPYGSAGCCGYTSPCQSSGLNI